ncbi:MAG: hypothetical protein E7256_18140 [Lachnospiraceae bacterium]|nr:hypothetical protein [Lachnospiraceae bacterium]
MFKQDYIMRLINEIIRAILKLLFHIDTESPTVDLLENKETQNTLNSLLCMVDQGKIDEAENRIYEMTANGEMENLKIALLFYSYLNDKDDQFLKEHDFSRDEICLGIKNLASRYGLSGMVDAFLM